MIATIKSDYLRHESASHSACCLNGQQHGNNLRQQPKSNPPAVTHVMVTL